VNVLVAGGGTGGHVFPALAVADALRRRGARVRFVGAEDGPEATAVPAAGYEFAGVRVRSAQTRLSWRTVRAVGSILRAAVAVRSIVRQADVVVSVGGFASAPAVLAARWTSTPVVLIEPNGVPGVVNRFAARWAVVAATAFDVTSHRLPSRLRIRRTGNPIRPEIVDAAADPGPSARAALERFGLEPDRRTVIVLGGSQGALSLDRAVAGALPLLRDRADLQLLVSAGPAHVDVVTAAIDPAAAVLVRVVAFIERMDLALALADLAVSRSGGSVAELAACGVPAILVPYPYATENHQEANARELADRGGARMILDPDMTAQVFTAGILDLMDDDEARASMSAAMRAWAHPGAADEIAELVLEVGA